MSVNDKLSQLIDWVNENKMWGVVIALIVVFTLGLGYYYEVERTEIHLFRRVEYPLIDLRHRVLARPDKASDDIVILGITEDAIFRYRDVLGRWPWPRRIMAYIFQYLQEADQIMVDIGYWEPSRTQVTQEQAQNMYRNLERVRNQIIQQGRFPVNDYEQLLNQVGDLARSDDQLLAQGTALTDVYHALTFDFQQNVRPGRRSLQEYRQLTKPFGYNIEGPVVFPRVPTAAIPIEELLEKSAGFGHINFIPDPDGPARRFAPFIGFNAPADSPAFFETPYLPMLGLAGVLPRSGV
ncbi:MAG: CHASE2 domain-containing protein, partial [bacterium]